MERAFCAHLQSQHPSLDCHGSISFLSQCWDCSSRHTRICACRNRRIVRNPLNGQDRNRSQRSAYRRHATFLHTRILTKETTPQHPVGIKPNAAAIPCSSILNILRHAYIFFFNSEYQRKTPSPRNTTAGPPTVLIPTVGKFPSR